MILGFTKDQSLLGISRSSEITLGVEELVSRPRVDNIFKGPKDSHAD